MPLYLPDGFDELLLAMAFDDDRDTVDLDAEEDVLYPFGKDFKTLEFTTEQAQLYTVLKTYIPADSAIREFGINNLDPELSALLTKCLYNSAAWMIICSIGHDREKVLDLCEALVKRFSRYPDIRGRLKADLHEPMSLFGVDFSERW